MMEKPLVYNVEECSECKVPKGWGHEIIFENNEKYCGKVLVSMHYHMIKDETWYVESGEFLYKWIDTETAELHQQTLKVGDTVRQYPGQPHQLFALTEGRIYEVSTTHYDSDSYRVWRGDSLNH
jgi:mannose-6-phosphate isomerase-like protein (cupin superfamily)